MDTIDAIRTVLAVRQYQAKPIPRDAVDQIVRAGQLTASSMNKQPWHFIVVDDPEELRKLGELVHSGPYIAQAPLAIVVAMEDTQFSESDASRAIQSMVLAAWDLGIGSNWTGFYGLDAVKPLLDIPDGMKVLAVIPFGYPAKAVGKGKKNRKSLAQIASRNKYGVPYSS